MWRPDSFEKTLMLGRLRAGGKGDYRGWDGRMDGITDSMDMGLGGRKKGNLLPKRYTQFTQGQYICSQEFTLSFLIVVVQPPSYVWLFVTTWTAAQQAFLSFTTSQSLSKFMSIALVMPSSHLIFWHPLLLLPSIFPRIRDFSNESVLLIRWPKYWSFSFKISPSNESSGLISFRIA